MKNIFITTVLGPDSPGIIKSLAHTTRGQGGEWLTSKVIKLDGQFSAMMKVTVDEANESPLKKSLEKEFSHLQFIYSPALSIKEEPSKVINLVIDCRDRPGLTKDINSILSNLNLIVENMEFNRFHVSSLGETVFSAKIALSVPLGTNSEMIADEIEELSDDMRVNLTS